MTVNNTKVKEKREDEAQAYEKMRVLGICLGASTVSIAQVETGGDGPKLIEYSDHAHEGDPRRTLVKALGEYDLDSFDRVAATGRKFRSYVNLSSIPGPEAVQYAYGFVKPSGVDCPAVVSAGGETFMIYVLNRAGQISNVLTGNKCASGTGEFFLQQLRRLDVNLVVF